jgi:hypothetical protein
VFLYYQADEYIHAYHELNLTLGSGIYGSTFFMLTGFHGMHVTLGTIMLAIMWLRCAKGHFSKDNHFGVRGRGLVLALRRRGVARLVRVRLRALNGRPIDARQRRRRCRPLCLRSK